MSFRVFPRKYTTTQNSVLLCNILRLFHDARESSKMTKLKKQGMTYACAHVCGLYVRVRRCEYCIYVCPYVYTRLKVCMHQ